MMQCQPTTHSLPPTTSHSRPQAVLDGFEEQFRPTPSSRGHTAPSRSSFPPSTASSDVTHLHSWPPLASHHFRLQAAALPLCRVCLPQRLPPPCPLCDPHLYPPPTRHLRSDLRPYPLPTRHLHHPAASAPHVVVAPAQAEVAALAALVVEGAVLWITSLFTPTSSLTPWSSTRG